MLLYFTEERYSKYIGYRMMKSWEQDQEAT